MTFKVELTLDDAKLAKRINDVAPAYQDAVDKAVEAAATGVTDYSGAIRETLRQTAGTGLTVDGSEKVTYASGHRRRLDSAVRMNVIDAVRQVQQQSAAVVGRETGCDAVELSAHPFSAQDHEPVQGRVFTNEEFERMQLGLDVVDADGRHHDGFPRPVGIWNCRHFAAPFQLGVSKRRYTDEQLDQWREANQKGCELWGRWLNPETGKYEEGYKHFTTYGAGQYMRQLETAMRKQRDIENAAKVSGDAVLRRDAQQKRRTLSEQYKYVAETSGLKARFERTRAESVLKSSGGRGIINTGGEKMAVDIEIDQFTPCLQERETGKIVDTQYALASPSELIGLKKHGWLFNWNHKSLKDSDVYKLMVKGDTEIQGLVAMELKSSNLAYHVSLAESAPRNRGAEKIYEGVGGHLFAIAAKKSMEAGFGGFIYFEAKNIELVRHYSEKFGAIWMRSPHEYSMIIDEEAAQVLLSSYTLD